MAKFFNSRAADEIVKQTRRLRDDPVAVDNVRLPVRIGGGGPETIRFICDEAVPAYGVMVLANTAVGSDASILTMKQADRLHPGPYFVNGSSGVGANTVGKCRAFGQVPLEALVGIDYIGYNTAFTWAGLSSAFTTDGEDATLWTWGIIPDTWSLGAGLPGMTCIGDVDATNGTAKFISAGRPVFWGRATQNWTSSTVGVHTVVVNPMFYRWSTGWDWSETSGTLRKQINATVSLANRREVSSTYYGMVRTNKVPNVEANDELLIAAAHDGGAYDWVCLSDFLDDPIGTIRFLAVDPPAGTSPAPKGWALCDGTDNAVGNGGSGKNLINAFIEGYTSEVGPFASQITTGSGTKSIYQAWIIERLDNSI